MSRARYIAEQASLPLGVQLARRRQLPPKGSSLRLYGQGNCNGSWIVRSAMAVGSEIFLGLARPKRKQPAGGYIQEELFP